MEKPKRKRYGDRRDGERLCGLDPLHIFVPYLMPNRCDCEAYITEQIDLTNLIAYLEKKNANNSDFKYTMFHVFAAAMLKTIVLRPKMNRFIQGKRLYMRNELSLAFVAKKKFQDDEHEALLYLRFDENATIDIVHDRIKKEVTETRRGHEDNSTHYMGILGKLPRWLLSLVMWWLRYMDFHGGRAPFELVKDDPDFASVYISNLGSIKLNAAYHHLNNWGTNSVFAVIGEKHKTPYFDDDGNATMREALNFSITLDERIADGYYYAKTFKLLKCLLQNPELLEAPAKEAVDYDI
ncbi:MAG: 2-oxo acid dehydrogenase subunit E2 [Clostridia bacterium]